MNNNQTGAVALSRDVRLRDVTMIGIGGIIGIGRMIDAGIFVSPGIAAGDAGPALVLAFVLNGIVTSLTAIACTGPGFAIPEARSGFL